MKRVILSALLTIALSPSLYAWEMIGSIASIVGDVDVTSLSKGKKFLPQAGTTVTTDHRIRTGKNSFAEIVLNDGSKIFLKEITVLSLSSLKIKESDPPTIMRMITGKLRITMKKTFKSRSLVVHTPTAIAGVRGTDFGVIAGKDDTKVVVFEGQVEVANADRDVIKSFVMKEREETSIKKDLPPTPPRIVPQPILENWFEYYTVDEKSRIIIRDKKEGVIDRLLKKRDF